MAHKGEFKPPVEPIRAAFDKATELIDKGGGERVALFMVGGKVMSTRSTSHAYTANLQRLRSNLIGVYDIAADSRALMADLKVFYRELV